MILTKFSNLQIVHTAGTHLSIADILSRDFSEIIKKMCQLQHKCLPPHIEFIQLKPKNSVKQTLLNIKMSDKLKNDSHPILVAYGDDQFALRILDKGNSVIYTPVDSFSFQSVSSFFNKYKKPIKTKVKTLLQKYLLLNETDIYEDDDPLSKRIPHQKS